MSSVIRQKGESQNGCFKESKHTNFSEKQTFLTPWYAQMRISCLPEELALDFGWASRTSQNP